MSTDNYNGMRGKYKGIAKKFVEKFTTRLEKE